MLWMGVGFIVLGALASYWGWREERQYYNSLADRPDLREYVTHSPERPGLGALRVGGGISVAVGVVLLIMAIFL